MTDAQETQNDLPNAVSSIFAGLRGLMRDEAAEEFRKHADDPDIKEAGDALRLMDCIEFSDVARRRLKPLEGLLNSKIGYNYRAEFLFMHGGFVESHLERIIQDVEGSYAYVDKARHVLRRATSASALGIRIDLGADEPDSYWMPKKVFRTHEEIMPFVDALHSLFYGDGDDFIEQSLKIRLAHGLVDDVGKLLSKLLPPEAE